MSKRPHHHSDRSQRPSRSGQKKGARQAPLKPGETKRQRNRGGKSSGQSDTFHLYGSHAIRAALSNPNRKSIRLCATENALSRMGRESVERAGVITEITPPRELDSMVPADAVHQGLVLVCEPLTPLDASELFHLADKKLVVVLDQITDPHNVGAILRSAVAFDADAVVLTHRNSAQETGALAKSASGALDMVPIIDVRNLSKALEELNDMGFISVGLDSEGPLVLEETLATANPDKAVLVLGSEGKGLREQTRQTCTHLARLDMPGEIKSLNVSNAAALSLYVVRQALSR